MLLAWQAFSGVAFSTVMAGFLVTGRFLRLDIFSLVLVCLVLCMWDLSWSVLLGFVHLLFLMFISDSSCVWTIFVC